jgi:ADP-ribose pyrophosphatase YjhB (NUDIX family)
VAVLAGWQVCPRCGSPLANDGSKVECASCGLVHYANPAPAVSAVVVDDAGNVLLARRAHDPDAGLWDTLGGFLDVGEEPEAGLRRELREEAGVEIELGELVTMYVDRYGDDTDAPPLLVLLWEATIASGEPEPADDVAELRWFPRSTLPRPEEIAFHALPSVLAAWAAEQPLDAPKGRLNRPFG